MKRIVPSDETYPLSRNERSWVLFSSRGSPVPSAATASSSSNGGAMKRSRRLIGRDFRLVLVVLLLLATPILPTVPPPPPPPPLPTPPPGLVERGVGKSAKKKQQAQLINLVHRCVSIDYSLIGKVFQWYRNCSATALICSISCSTSGGAPIRLIWKFTGSFSGGSSVFGRTRAGVAVPMGRVAVSPVSIVTI